MISPYHHGYLDASRMNTYVMGQTLHNFPLLRFALDTPASEAWAAGIADWIDDRRQPGRMSRFHPKWTLT